MLNYFLPKSTTEWTYIILIVVLAITLIVFYKGIMKCKSIIDTYNFEFRDYNKNLTSCRAFITYVDEQYSDIIPEYCVNSGITYQDFYSNINEVNTDNA